jgi:uncharacterized protein (DUF433 family)
MATRTRGLRLPEEVDRGIELERRLRGTSFSEEATGLLRESLRMRRTPGIYFVDGLDSRRAAVAGTGIEVWEVVATYKSAGEDYEELRNSYPQLSQTQLKAALSYYELYPEEVDARIEREEYWTPERVWSEFPFMRPAEAGEVRRGRGTG